MILLPSGHDRSHISAQFKVDKNVRTVEPKIREKKASNLYGVERTMTQGFASARLPRVELRDQGALDGSEERGSKR